MADTKAPYGDVEYADPGYLDADGNQASKSGKPGQKRYPIDAEHVVAAWDYINKANNAGQYTAEQLSSIKGRIRSAMKKFGHTVSDDSAAGSSRSAPYTRSFPVEDISIKPGDGRTVEAYATVFNIPSPVRDQDGDYEEIIDPSAFNRALDHSQRAKGGWNIPVLFNHGMTIWHTPSERHSVPIGVPEEIRADSRGLFTRTRFHKTPLADEVLEAIKDGSITGYSFSGIFNRSDPMVPHGGFRTDRGGRRQTVRRMESTLREFGPATFRVHDGAEVVGVRAEQAAMLLGNLAPGEFDRLAEMFRSGTPMLDPPDVGTPTDVGPAADDSPHGHSTRSPREELQYRRAQFLIRHGGGNG